MLLLASATARAAAPSPAPSAAPPLTVLYLNATRLDFYYNRFLIEGDGNVRLRTSDGFTVTGDAFSMDLKLNRFMVAGHVTLHDSTGTVSGAAISDFLDFRRIYFVPVTGEPDRWTFLDGDLAHPVKGRVMPDDAFYFPQRRRASEHHRDRCDRRHQDLRPLRQRPHLLSQRRRAAGHIRRQLLVQPVFRAEHALGRQRRSHLDDGRQPQRAHRPSPALRSDL